MKTDISELKTDIAVLKTDVAVLKTDFSETKKIMEQILTKLDNQSPSSTKNYSRTYNRMINIHLDGDNQ